MPNIANIPSEVPINILGMVFIVDNSITISHDSYGDARIRPESQLVYQLPDLFFLRKEFEKTRRMSVIVALLLQNINSKINVMVKTNKTDFYYWIAHAE